MLDDNDNVLLLRPAREGSGFGPSGRRAAVGAPTGRSDTYFAVIEYLWKDPNEGFSSSSSIGSVRSLARPDFRCLAFTYRRAAEQLPAAAGSRGQENLGLVHQGIDSR